MKNYTIEEITEMYGAEIVKAALESQAEPTSRVIYPAFEQEHAGKNEWDGDPVMADNGDKVRAFYYLTDEDEQDLDFFDWEGNVEFDVEPTL